MTVEKFSQLRLVGKAGLSALASAHRPDFIVAVEARGFLFGAARGILVREMRSYALPHHLRFSIGTEEEMQIVIDALKEQGVYQDADSGS